MQDKMCFANLKCAWTCVLDTTKYAPSATFIFTDKVTFPQSVGESKSFC